MIILEDRITSQWISRVPPGGLETITVCECRARLGLAGPDTT